MRLEYGIVYLCLVLAVILIHSCILDRRLARLERWAAGWGYWKPPRFGTPLSRNKKQLAAFAERMNQAEQAARKDGESS